MMSLALLLCCLNFASWSHKVFVSHLTEFFVEQGSWTAGICQQHIWTGSSIDWIDVSSNEKNQISSHIVKAQTKMDVWSARMTTTLSCPSNWSQRQKKHSRKNQPNGGALLPTTPLWPPVLSQDMFASLRKSELTRSFMFCSIFMSVQWHNTCSSTVWSCCCHYELAS